MLCNFPNFQCVSKVDIKALKQRSSSEQFVPSDFCFSVLWNYALAHEVFLSVLNDNLVVSCKEGVSKKYCCTVLALLTKH